MGLAHRIRWAIVVAAVFTAAAVVGLAVARDGSPPSQASLGGRDWTTLRAREARTGVRAYMARESYRPGARAAVVVTTTLRSVSLQVFRIGQAAPSGRRDELSGIAVAPRRSVKLSGRGGDRVTLDLGAWPSGMYYVELRAPDGRVGYAPFVLAPRRLGEHRVAVVMPTNTWAAYNRLDADGNGLGDTWYEDEAVAAVDMTRPYLDRGVPPHFGHYDFGFLRWLVLHGKAVDILSQRELEQVRSGDVLANAYDLIVFPGHHEYVTAHEFDVVERFRDLGGNLMFLSANNFYYKVTKSGDSMTRVGSWRNLGRPEAALTGVGFIHFVAGLAPYVLRNAPGTPWVFAQTGLKAGKRFASAGIEVDGTNADSPPGIQVLAEIPNLAGSGATAQMTYYETPRGARVFSAGAFTLAGAALWPTVSRVLDNLWARLARA
jgi:N,N-dimethylformamidase beta subunit-like, C-terminal